MKETFRNPVIDIVAKRISSAQYKYHNKLQGKPLHVQVRQNFKVSARSPFKEDPGQFNRDRLQNSKTLDSRKNGTGSEPLDDNLERESLKRLSQKRPPIPEDITSKFFPSFTSAEGGEASLPWDTWSTGWIPFASMFLFGIGAGVLLSSVINVEPKNVASREVIDEKTPNPSVCMANGMSAMVLDQRLFITFNPFNVYVSQAEVKPGCVLRRSNWQVLESRGLVNQEELRDCKRNMNTFGFVGDLRESPEVSCVYHSETAENQFLKDPKKAILGDGFTPRDKKDEGS